MLHCSCQGKKRERESERQRERERILKYCSLDLSKSKRKRGKKAQWGVLGGAVIYIFIVMQFNDTHVNITNVCDCVYGCVCDYITLAVAVCVHVCEFPWKISNGKSILIKLSTFCAVPKLIMHLCVFVCV